MIALFSGRLDRPHPGHIITLQRLGQMYDKVIVCLLDYPEQKYSISFRKGVVEEALHHSKGEYVVTSNKTHFAEITKEELNRLIDIWGWEVYVNANVTVLNHIERLAYETYYFPRYPEYSASKETS